MRLILGICAMCVAVLLCALRCSTEPPTGAGTVDTLYIFDTSVTRDTVFVFDTTYICDTSLTSDTIVRIDTLYVIDSSAGVTMHVLTGVIDSTDVRRYAERYWNTIEWGEPRIGPDWSYSVFLRRGSRWLSGEGFLLAENFLLGQERIWWSDTTCTIYLDRSLEGTEYKVVLLEPARVSASLAAAPPQRLAMRDPRRWDSWFRVYKAT